MKTYFPVSDALLSVLVSLEGSSAKVYKDTRGYPTIGVGHLLTDDDINLETVIGEPVPDRLSSLELTKGQIDKLLELDLQVFQEGLSSLFQTELNIHQYSACLSLAFNIGLASFKKSKLLTMINKGLGKDAYTGFYGWCGPDHNPGVVKRRIVEASIYVFPFVDIAGGNELFAGGNIPDNLHNDILSTITTYGKLFNSNN